MRHHKFEGLLVGQGVLQVICELCLCGPSVPPWRYLVVEGVVYIWYLQGPEDGTLKDILNELIL